MERNYRLEHFWLHREGMSNARFSQMLEARRIRRLLIAPLPDTHTSIELSWKAFSTVVLGLTVHWSHRSPLRPRHRHLPQRLQIRLGVNVDGVDVTMTQRVRDSLDQLIMLQHADRPGMPQGVRAASGLMSARLDASAS